MSSNKEVKPRKIAFAGGGTGGHIYPIIAVYEELKKQEISCEFLYFGSKDKLEEKVAEQNQIPFQSLPFIGGMPRSWKSLIWGFQLLQSSFKAVYELNKCKPDLVFGTGGYSAAPIFFAATLLKIPYIIHNLDAYLGLANKAFVKNCAALTLGLPLEEKSKLKCLPVNGPAIVVGNPVREAFDREVEDRLSIYKSLQLDSKKKTLVVIGGSQGAQFINEVFINVVPSLLEQNWQIIHQVGPQQFDKLSERFVNSPFYKPEKYLENLAEVYSIADLAVSRSGAMSLAELVSKEVPSIFIPLPTAAQNHQWHNAKFLEKHGCALLLEQKKLSEITLLENIQIAYERRHLLKLNLNNLSKQKSAKAITQIILGKINKQYL